jgi:hypothetical protein
MAQFSTEAYNRSIRNQVAIERLKSSAVKQVEPFLQNIDRYVRQRLAFSNLTTYSRDRLEKLLKSIRQFNTGQFKEYTTELQKELTILARVQAQYETNTLNSVIAGTFEAVTPSASQLTAAIVARPMSIRGVSGSPLLRPFVANFSVSQVAAIDGLLRQGVAEGQTNAEIIRNLRGTKSQKFRDGLLGGQTLRQSEAMVRTAVQHVATVSRATFDDLKKKAVP